MTTITQFTDLMAWQESHKVVLDIYHITNKFPREEQFGLTNQIRRAVISITSNIAEGFGRRGVKERIQFYYLAQGSLTEVKNQVFIARDVGYITEKESQHVMEQLNTAHALFQGLITKTKTFLNS